RYSCTLRAESDEGEGFTSTVLPLAQNRVVAAAEIPSEALEAMESAALLVHYGTESLEIPLVG
ncbi:MAG: hypothetical protein Q4A66_07395, partial [Eubacteriales bacterium]|nr:hypothetical protein [Eubacteriales bacterium]